MAEGYNGRNARRIRFITWNGKDVPPEFFEVPPGRYVEAVAEAPVLTPEDEAGIEASLESYRQGRIVRGKRARQIIDAALGSSGLLSSAASGRNGMVPHIPSATTTDICQLLRAVVLFLSPV